MLTTAYALLTVTCMRFISSDSNLLGSVGISQLQGRGVWALDSFNFAGGGNMHDTVRVDFTHHAITYLARGHWGDTRISPGLRLDNILCITHVTMS